MKNTNVILTLLISLLLSCKDNSNNPGLVYEIIKPGFSNRSYLIGSIHYIPKKYFNEYDSRKYFFSYIDKCDYFIMEANTDSFRNMHKKFIKDFNIKNNIEKLNAEELNYLTHFLQDTLKLNVTNIQKVLQSDPIITSTGLEKLYCNEEFFYMDQYLRSYCQQTDKAVVFLDSPERYYYYFCQYNLETYNNPWYKSDSSKRVYFKELDYIFKRYGKTAFNKDSINMTSINKLVEQRNQEWLPIVLEMIEKDECVILVGEAHLEGLIELLTNNSYEIKQKQKLVLTP